MAIDEDHLLLSRLAFGASPRDRAALRLRGGLGAWVNAQLSPPEGDDLETAARLSMVRLPIKYDAGEGYAATDEQRPLRLIAADMDQLWPLNDGKAPFANPERVRPRQEVFAATLTRAIYSPWQLREVMVDFWHNHFTVYADDRAIGVCLPVYDRMLRSHVFGNFREMLEAVATSPAMQLYLNNRTSRAGAANENYARELFELHAMGRPAYLNALYNRWKDVPGAAQGKPQGYIDQDVYEAARAFTGWTIEDGSGIGGGVSLPNTGRFAYHETWHDGYQKRILATDFDPFQPPMADGRKVLDLVAFHPATAQYLCTKLCRRLVADDPSPQLVADAVKIWRAEQNNPRQIAKVISAIAQSPEIRRPPGAKVKRPMELAAGFIRACGMDPSVTIGLLNELDGSGQRLFGRASPDGYPDRMDYWLSSGVLRRRWSLLAGISENWWGTGAFDPGLRLPPGISAADGIQAWHREITGVPADPNTLLALLAGSGLKPGDPAGRQPQDQPPLRRAVALIGMTPLFNLR